MTLPEREKDVSERPSADWNDQASDFEIQTTRNSILEVQARCRPVQVAKKDGSFEFEDCQACGNEIGLGRLKVAIQNHLCIQCAAKRERLFK